MDGPHLRSLQKALDLVGGSKPRLAVALSISEEELEGYLAGESPLPHGTFLDVLDIVAGKKERAGRG